MDISIIKNAVDDKFIQSIIDVGESQGLQEATVGFDTSTNKIRSTKISWISDKEIILPLKDKILETNKSKDWNYTVTGMFPFQYSVYHKMTIMIGILIEGLFIKEKMKRNYLFH